MHRLRLTYPGLNFWWTSACTSSVVGGWPSRSSLTSKVKVINHSCDEVVHIYEV